MNASDALNKQGQKFLNTENTDANLTKEDAKKFKELTSAKSEACANYEEVGGDELKKLQEACK